MFNIIENATFVSIWDGGYSVAEKWKNGEEVTISGKIPAEEEMQDIHDYMDNY